MKLKNIIIILTKSQNRRNVDAKTAPIKTGRRKQQMRR
jgi:hypothetical protein